MNDEEERQGVNVGVSTDDATQTDSVDSVDGVLLVPSHPFMVHHHNNNIGAEPSQIDGGFLSTFFTKVIPVRRIFELDYPEGDPFKSANNRTISTQTEEQDPISARGLELSYYLIQELSLQNPVATEVKDHVYISLASCVCDMLVRHSILFNGMIRRCQVTHYHIFNCIANEIFEANEAGQLRITWGRILSLFAFAVRLAQEYREDPEQVDSIIRFLSSYMMKHLVPFVRANGGWVGLVEHFPPPADDDAQVKRAILWSGLCVGLMATMYITSCLSSSR